MNPERHLELVPDPALEPDDDFAAVLPLPIVRVDQADDLVRPPAEYGTLRRPEPVYA